MSHLDHNDVGIHRVLCCHRDSESDIASDLRRRGFRIYHYNSETAHDESSMLCEVMRAFEAADLSGDCPVSWSGAADYVWQRLMERPDHMIALFILHADEMAENRLQLFVDCIEFLYDLGEIVERQESVSFSHRILLRVVAFGEGRGFSLWK